MNSFKSTDSRSIIYEPLAKRSILNATKKHIEIMGTSHSRFSTSDTEFQRKFM